MSLNDPQWGRGSTEEEKKSSEDKVQEPTDQDNRADKPADESNKTASDKRRADDNDGDDLDRLWNEFNRALGGILGEANREESAREASRQQTRQDDFRRDEAPRAKPSFERIKKMGAGATPPSVPMNGKGIAFGFVAALGIWAATGFYIVPEGQSGIVTTFGKYTETTMPGFRWHLPTPIQNVEIVDVSSVRTVEIGALGRANRESEALMLTDDENIVDLRFNVQYRIKPGEGAMNYLFKSRNPDDSVRHSAESAMREVVGRLKMDNVLFESKQEIAEAVKRIMQDMLDRYQTGIEVMTVAIQNAQPPQPVQAAFNDAVKAGQDRERQINEGQAYANAVIPKARGMAARLTQEAEGYKARVVETAQGDAERFTKVLKEYEKAPQVTRDRMYVDVMQQVMTSTTKVYVDTKDGNNLLYLPFDKLMQQNQKQAMEAVATQSTGSVSAQAAEVSDTTPVQTSVRDIRRMR